MAKQKVTLSLNSDIYKRTKDFLALLPGKPSVSSLVDDVLEQFLTRFGEAFKKAQEEGLSPREFMKVWHADTMTDVSVEYAELVRMLKEKEEKKE